jgi:hypothetical protein
MEIKRNSKKNIFRIVLTTAFILLIPLVSMHFSDEVNWSLFDFIVIGTLLIGTGLIYELGARKMGNAVHRIVFGIVLVAALLLIWVDLAVGIFGTPFSGS